MASRTSHRSSVRDPRLAAPARAPAPPPQPQPQSAIPASIPDTRLGLSTDEVATLRQHQAIALSQQPRGRGSGSGRTSREASAASSQQGQGQGRLMLDPTSLGVLAGHFERVMGAIQGRLMLLNQQTDLSISRQSTLSTQTVAAAEAEIRRFHAILAQIDELEIEFDKIRHIREIVRGIRARVEGLERRVG